MRQSLWARRRWRERGVSSRQPPGRRSGRRWAQLGFSGGRPLLYPPASTASSKSKPKKDSTSSKDSASSSSPKKTNTRPFGIQKVTPVSSALAHFLNSHSAFRVDAVNKIWSYIKLHNLQTRRTNKFQKNLLLKSCYCIDRVGSTTYKECSSSLQNPTNKREIYCYAKLKSIFVGKERVGFLEIGKLLTPRFETE